MFRNILFETKRLHTSPSTTLNFNDCRVNINFFEVADKEVNVNCGGHKDEFLERVIFDHLSQFNQEKISKFVPLVNLIQDNVR